MTAAVAAALAAVLVLGGVAATPVLLLAVLLAQALFVAGWFPALQVASPVGGWLVVAATAVAADVAVLAGDDTRPLAQVSPVLALALIASLAHQLARRDGRGGLTGSLTATGAGAVLAGLGSAWLALDVSGAGNGLLVVAAAAGAAPAVADLGAARLHLPRWAGPLVAAVGTLVVGLVVGVASATTLAVATTAAAGAAVAARLAVLLADRVAAPHPLLPAALPVLVVGPVVYVLGRVLVG